MEKIKNISVEHRFEKKNKTQFFLKKPSRVLCVSISLKAKELKNKYFVLYIQIHWINCSFISVKDLLALQVLELIPTVLFPIFKLPIYNVSFRENDICNLYYSGR